jgi:hypothetical protein
MCVAHRVFQNLRCQMPRSARASCTGERAWVEGIAHKKRFLVARQRPE